MDEQNFDFEFEQIALRRFLEAILFLFITSGLYGTFWINDEFSGTRAAAVAFIGIPALTFKILLDFQLPKWRHMWPKWCLICHLSVVATFAWGNILILNAVGEDQTPVVVSKNLSSATVNLHQTRGSFGLLYSTRW